MPVYKKAGLVIDIHRNRWNAVILSLWLYRDNSVNQVQSVGVHKKLPMPELPNFAMSFFQKTGKRVKSGIG
jgi:hypothetical protein